MRQNQLLLFYPKNLHYMDIKTPMRLFGAEFRMNHIE